MARVYLPFHFTIARNPSHQMTTRCDRRIRFENLHLNRQLPRIGPVIIRIQPCNVLASAPLERVVVVPAHSRILASFQYANHIRITLPIAASDLERSIRRGIVTNDNLKRKIRFLCEGAVKGPGKPSFQIKCRDRYTNEWGHSHLQGQNSKNSRKRLPANTRLLCPLIQATR